MKGGEKQMLELVFRSLLVLVCASIGSQVATGLEEDALWGISLGIAAALIFIALESALSRRPIQAISAIIFGIIAGSLVAVFFFYIAKLAIQQNPAVDHMFKGGRAQLEQYLLVSLLVICCFMLIMVIYKTMDRFRFIIPYMEFQKEEKGSRPILLDTSAIIDGRLADLCETHILDTMLIVPKFVLQELQHVADSGDRLRRNRGRRGLEMLQRLQRDESVSVQIHDGRAARGSTVDSKLVSLADQLQARILTCDYNLSKLAEIQNVDTVNLNDLTNALRPTVLPGEDLSLKILRPGDEPGQGVGYMTDGTMVVVENAREKQNQTVNVVVTSTLQTSAGRMIFGRLRHEGGGRNQGDEEKDKEKERDGGRRRAEKTA